MVRFNRIILLLRLLLASFIAVVVVSNLVGLSKVNNEEIYWHFFPLILSVFLVFAFVRILRLIFSESIDIIVSAEGISLKNIITRKSRVILKEYIQGYSIEKYNWNVIKLPGVKSFWEFESKMVVVYSQQRALIHLKSLNYKRGTKLLVDNLDINDYVILSKRRRVFDKWRFSPSN